MSTHTEQPSGMGDNFISGDDDMADDNGRTTALAIPVPHESGEHEPLADFRALALATPVEKMLPALNQYKERRTAFRKWIREQLVEGVHFGTPPGCEPKLKQDEPNKGFIGIWSSKKNCYNWYPPEQWTPKPSLYKAGADFVIDCLAVRDEYDADMLGWEQLGKPVGTFIYRCRLWSRLNGELISEGRGVRKVGQKGGDENNAIKMAQKSAKVDAVLNAYGLSDLFTQDLEPGDQGPENDNPKKDPKVPTATPREQRVTKEDCKQVYLGWKSLQYEDEVSTERFECWVFETCALPVADVKSAAKWTRSHVDSCLREIEKLKAKREGRSPNGELFDNEGPQP